MPRRPTRRRHVPDRAIARRAGRPRSAAADEAIRRAALILFIEHGTEGMSIEAVAARAGTGKASIYRRWRSKEDLLIDAVIEVFAAASKPNAGNVRDDLVQSTRDLQALMSSSTTGAVFPRMAPEMARRTPLGRLYGHRVIGPRRAIFDEILRRGIARRELPMAIDVELAVDHLVGTLLLRRLTGRLKQSDSRLAERVVDLLLAGLRSRDL